MVFFLTTGLAYAGAETQLVRIAVRLKARNWDVRIISMLPPAAYVQELQDAGIEIHSLGMRPGLPDPKGLWRLIHILRHEQPQLLTCFMYHASLLGRLAGRIAGVPVISSIRTENLGGPMRDRLMRISSWMDNVTVINSSLVAEALVRRKVSPPGRLRIIPNGLEIKRYQRNPQVRKQMRQQLGLGSDDFLWLAVGRLEAPKDYPTLLKAFVPVVNTYPTARLCIAGKGPLLDDLRILASSLGILEKVAFLGLRSDIPDLLNAADAFVLSSAWEGLPNAVMEALAASLPVVATRVGGTSELVEDTKSGFLVSHKDPIALSQMMLLLMSLPLDKRVGMGEHGRSHMDNNYSMEHIVDLWEELFINVLNRSTIN